MTDRTCPTCQGPKDILHTPAECAQIALTATDETIDRYHLSIIASVIGRSPSSMAAAYRLYVDGFLKAPRAGS